MSSFKSSGNIQKKESGPYRGFAYWMLISDPIHLAKTARANFLNLMNCYRTVDAKTDLNQSETKDHTSIFRRPRADNSVVFGEILPRFKLIQAFMHAHNTCKNEEDQIKNEDARVATTFSHYKYMRGWGGLKPQSKLADIWTHIRCYGCSRYLQEYRRWSR